MVHRIRGMTWRPSLVLAAFMAVLAIGIPVGESQAQRASAPGSSPNREAMERQLQERLFAMVQRELHLTPQQAERLRAVSRQTDERRGPMLRRERELRKDLREELGRDQRADDARVARLLDGLFDIQEERLELAQSEQRELGRFLSPVQRARYLSIQENWRRRVWELETRDRRDGTDERRGRRPPSPDRPGGMY